jgi:hypothetical protein
VEAKNHESLKLILQVTQLVAVVIGIAGLAIGIGRRDMDLTHATNDIQALQVISSDLVKATIEGASTDQYHRERIDELRVRLTELEKKTREGV